MIETLNISDFSKYKKQARAKFVSHSLAAGLMRAGSEKNKKHYRRIADCSGKLQNIDGKLKTHYCNSKLCLVCSRIRTANLINGYYDELDKIKQKSLVTLTLPNVAGHELAGTLKKMNYLLTRSKASLKKRYGVEFIGIRHLEITYNEQQNTYHPHYHIILNDKKIQLSTGSRKLSQILIKYWIRTAQKKYQIICNRRAQDHKKADNHSIKEIFKYFAKTIYKRSQRKGNVKITEIKVIKPQALDKIFSATDHRRMFQAFGGIKKKQKQEETTAEKYYKFDHFQSMERTAEMFDLEFNKGTQYYWSYHDWIDYDTGEILTGYKPTDELKRVLRKAGYTNKFIEKTIIKNLQDDNYNKILSTFVQECSAIDQKYKNFGKHKEYVYKPDEWGSEKDDIKFAYQKLIKYIQSKKVKTSNEDINPVFYETKKAI